jgi:hypothetical protein
MDEEAMKEDEPRCPDCRAGIDTNAAITYTPAEDAIEVIPEDEKHAPNCDIHFGGDCSCM